MGIAFEENPAYFTMAIVGTTLFVVKMLLLLISGDGDDGSVAEDVDAEMGHADGGATFSLVSIQSILAFFMGTGWIGLAARREWDMEKFPALLAAVGFGFAMMALSAFLTMKIKQLNSIPKFNMKEALGKTGRAYTQIPAEGQGIGQVEITVHGKQQILQAMSLENEPIKSFSAIKVENVDDSGNLIVAKV